MQLVFFVVVAAVILMVVVGASRYAKTVATEWGAAAATLGLDYDQQRFSRPRLTGTIRGMRVQVDVRVQRSGKSQQSFTRYRVFPPSPGFQFKLTRQTGFSRITKLFGAQDVETGDRAFDDAFVVKSSDPNRLQDLLDVGIMNMLVRTSAAYPGVVFENDLVIYERSGLETKRDVIVSAVRRLVDTATALSGGGMSRSRREAIEARQRGELAELAAKMKEAAHERARTLDEELLELDTLATAGEREAARERVRRLEEQVPADPEVVGWKRRLDAAPAGAAAVSGVEAAELAEEMFAENALSFESKQIFDERYRGASVRWTGSVKTVDRVHSDGDLGNEGDAKLVATVATIEHDLYGNTDIDAVVGLPPGAGANLRRGAEVTFSGTLVGVDPLVRNIFVARGTLG